ncbi:MAG TPA: hypothetical protein VI322_02310, partial [Candidatus Saccharimonadia bacterium]
LVTKDEFNVAIGGLVTKVEFNEAVSGLATKKELRAAVFPLATKDDLDRMESRLTTAMGLLERDSFSRLDDHEARITRLEKARG